MTQTLFPIGSTDSATAPTFRDDQLQTLETNLLTTGIMKGNGGEMAVTQRGAGANMSVDVASGLALTSFTNTNLTPSKTYKSWHSNDATVNVGISTADATNPRKDIIVAKIDGTANPNASATNLTSIYVIAGTPADSPTAPAVPSGAQLLATINVAAGATSIVTANIVDGRSYIQIASNNLPDIARVTETAALRTDTPMWIGTVSGTNTLTGSVTPAPTAYTVGQRFAFIVANNNSGSVTLNVNSLGAKTIKQLDGATNLSASYLKAGQIAVVIYDGTNFQLVSPIGLALFSVNDKTVYLSAVASSAAGASSTSETYIDTHTYTIPANDLIAGVAYEYEIGYISKRAVGTMQIAVKLGSTTVTNVLFTPAGDGQGTIRGMIVGTAAAGASAVVKGSIEIIHGQETSNKFGSDIATAGTFATNGTLTLQWSVLFSASDVGNSMTFHMCRIRKVSTTAF